MGLAWFGSRSQINGLIWAKIGPIHIGPKIEPVFSLNTNGRNVKNSTRSEEGRSRREGGGVGFVISLMRRIRLPNPPCGFSGMPEMLEGGVVHGGVIRRAVVIGNGFSGAESQCIGLLRALRLSSHYSVHVTYSLTLSPSFHF